MKETNAFVSSYMQVQGKIMKYTAFCEKWNKDYAACLKNAANILVAYTNKMNF